MFVQTARLPVGTRLYHGTVYKYRRIRGPAWFTDSYDTAMWFATDWARDHEGMPVVQEYEVHTPVDLIFVTGYNDEEFVFPIADMLGVEEFLPYDLAPLVCRAGFSGWFAEEAYVEHGIPGRGADILLCVPSRWLRRIR